MTSLLQNKTANISQVIFKRLESKLQIRHPTDWCKIPRSTLKSKDAKQLLEQHNDSLKEMLQAFYPEIQWDTLK